jgi:hypothetical protein
LQLKSPPEANISQTTTLPQLKAPPEANISQSEISANINLQNILGEALVQDEDMDLREEPVQDEESRVSSISTFAKNNDDGLLFVPTCTNCFNENKPIGPTARKSAFVISFVILCNIVQY